MKRTLVMLLFLLLPAACAEKQEVFDSAAVFTRAEEHMQKGNYEKARLAYQEIQEKALDRSYDAALMLRIADTYFGEEKFEEARVEYQSFLNYHPANKDAPYAQYQLAMCSYSRLSTIDRDPEMTREALKEFRELLKKYPGSPYEERARNHLAICLDRLAQYELYVGRFYRKKEAYQSAIGRLERMLADYPGSSVEKEAMYEAGISYLRLGMREKAKNILEALARKYPSMAGKAKALMERPEAPEE